VPVNLPPSLFLKGLFQGVKALANPTTLTLSTALEAVVTRFATTSTVLLLGLSVLQHLGLVQELNVDTSHLQLTLTLTKPQLTPADLEALSTLASVATLPLFYCFAQALLGVQQYRGQWLKSPTLPI
jgi:hypothetical protein